MTDTTLRGVPDDAVDTTPLSTAPVPRRPVAGLAGRLTGAWRQLTSMRTALILLFLLALAAVPGSLLPQRGLNAIAVATFYQQHPHLAPILDRLSLFDVFAAPWFAAIYLLLFVSLVGCLGPRCRLHLRALASQPPPAPRNLRRLRTWTSWTDLADPRSAGSAAAVVLRRRRFRVSVREEAGGAVSVAAEKGYLRETGNLLFHVSLVGLLVGIALGGLYGYKGTVIVVEGQGFSNTLTAYDTFTPGRLFSEGELAPFTVNLRSFTATYTSTGEPVTFNAPLTYTARPGGPVRTYDEQVNHPLDVGGTKVYLIGHGYAPVFRVRDGAGRLVYDAPTVFLPQNQGTFVSLGVVKVPDAEPEELGFDGFFFPTAGVGANGTLTSEYPAAREPVVALRAWRGNLGLNSGAAQSVYNLDTAGLTKIGDEVLSLGETWRLPHGGSLTFAGVDQYATLQVTHDPGRTIALVSAAGVVLGLILSLRVRRRRLWLRAAPDPGGDGAAAGRTVVDVAGLARTDHDDFADEFTALVGALAPGGRSRSGDAAEE